MTFRFYTPNEQFLDAQGEPLAGGFLYFYITGTNTPQNTYQDVNLTVPNTNPVVLDSAGRAGNIFFIIGASYKVVLANSANVTQWTADPVSDPTASGGQFTNSVSVSGAQATNRGVYFQTSGLNRFGIYLNSTPETGSNSGSDLVVESYNDAGSPLATAFTITRSTGSIVWPSLPIFPGTSVAAGGRLTLTSGTPVLSSTVSGATRIYYTPYLSNMCPMTDGFNLWMSQFAELSQALSDTTKSPAAAVASSVYDIFLWNDTSVGTGVFRATRGPAWSSSTSRGSGAGTTQLTRNQGTLVNQYAITNGPGALSGIYLGTIATNGSGTVDFILGGLSAGGTAGVLNVWNMFNRVDAQAIVMDNTSGWTFATANTIRAANGSSTMRVNFVSGLAEDTVRAEYSCSCNSASSAFVGVGIGVDTTTAFSGMFAGTNVTAGGVVSTGKYLGSLLGSHYVSACEGVTTATATFASGSAVNQNGLTFSFKM